MRQLVISVTLCVVILLFGFFSCASAATTDTVTTNPVVLIDFQYILDATVIPRKALEDAYEYHLGILKNPPNIEARDMALIGFWRTGAKIDVYESVLAELLSRSVIVIDDPSSFTLVTNPLPDGAWGVN